MKHEKIRGKLFTVFLFAKRT